MTLQRSHIVAAALALLNQDGLDGVTVRKVATQLNVHVGGLYWHVKNKRDLLDEMANTILSEEFATLQPPGPGQVWAEWLVELLFKLLYHSFYLIVVIPISRHQLASIKASF
jgi:TetR/AcrR family transcriptional regulator, tetracycline repressor protein